MKRKTNRIPITLKPVHWAYLDFEKQKTGTNIAEIIRRCIEKCMKHENTRKRGR